MQTCVSFNEGGLHPFIRHKIKWSKRLGVSGITAVHEPGFKTPVETGGVRIQGTLGHDRCLIEQWLVRPIRKQVAEVVIVYGRPRVARDAALDPAVKLQARFRFLLFDSLFRVFDCLAIGAWCWRCASSDS